MKNKLDKSDIPEGIISSGLMVGVAGLVALGSGLFMGWIDETAENHPLPYIAYGDNTIEVDLDRLVEHSEPSLVLYISNIEDVIEVYPERRAEVDATTDKLEEDFSTTCLSALNTYFDNELLVDTPEGEVIDDLLSTPDTPCGVNPTEIRVAYNSASLVYQGEQYLGSVDYNDLIDIRDDAKKQLQDDQENKTGRSVFYGAWVGLGLIGVGMNIKYRLDDGYWAFF